MRIDSDTKEFVYTDADGEEYAYTITYKPDSKTWSVLQSKETYVYDRYARSSPKPTGSAPIQTVWIC